MLTDFNGNFLCECGYETTEDVSKLKKKGLDYPIVTNAKTRIINKSLD